MENDRQSTQGPSQNVPSSSQAVWLAVGLIAGLALLTVIAFISAILLIGRSQLSVPSRAPASSVSLSTVVPTPTTLPQPTSVSVLNFDTVLLNDSFDNPKESSLGTGASGSAVYAFVDGTYQVTVMKPQYIAWSPFSGTYSNVSVEVDTRFDTTMSDTAAGIIFDYQDEKNFYFYSITADGHYALDLQHNGKWIALVDWTESPKIKSPGQSNRLRVDVIGDRIRLYVNGTLLDEASDDTFTSGGMALSVNTFEKSYVTVKFDNLLVKGSK
jgi:hypothetical protein